MLRLVVHPSEGLFGDKYAGGKTVILPQNSCTSGESLEDAVGQDIDIDVRGLARCAVRVHRGLATEVTEAGLGEKNRSTQLNLLITIPLTLRNCLFPVSSIASTGLLWG